MTTTSGISTYLPVGGIPGNMILISLLCVKLIISSSKTSTLNLLGNVGYAAFARKDFAYPDYRVSEIITGYGMD
jgi:hypothetical protein